MALPILRMKRAHVIWMKYFTSPKSSSALAELARQRCKNYGVDCMPEYRQRCLTMSAAQLDNLIANVQAHPTAAEETPHREKWKWKPATAAKETKHRAPWNWETAVYDVAKRNWAASQESVK